MISSLLIVGKDDKDNWQVKDKEKNKLKNI